MIKALIVDDLVENLYLLETLLKGYDYIPVSAKNGAEALSLALKDPPDIIISDILMPVMDGYTLCHEWKNNKRLKNIPFVFYTATYTHYKDEEFALSLGADMFIVKPQEPDQFILLIKKVLKEFKISNIPVHVPSESSELTVYKEYNETLIRKMEERMLKSQEEQKEIKEYATKLENEIEQRRLTLKALDEGELRFRTLAEVAPVGIFSTDEDGATLYVNPRWCEIAKMNPEEAMGVGWLKAVHPDDRNFISNGWKEASSLHEISHAEYRFLHKNGEITWVSGQAVPQKDTNGRIIGFIGTISDITERKKAEEEIRKLNEELEQRVMDRTSQLQAANKELEAFSYSVSHDLRAPLRAIRSFTSILKEDHKSKLDEEGNRLLDLIDLSSDHMAKLIDDLLTFSRANRAEMQHALVDMDMIFKSVYSELSISADGRRISFKCLKLLPVYGDNSLLRQVATNLISNAIKYTSKSEHADICIDSKKLNNEIVFSVKDNGVGFDMQYAKRLFGVFQRLHSSKEFEGNGVGLAIVQSIIARHGGRVWAEAEVGKGATFYFTLPVTDNK
jgi:PAS domain S-box-containing protein